VHESIARAIPQVVALDGLPVKSACLDVGQGARVRTEALAVQVHCRREHGALVGTDQLSRRGATRDVHARGPQTRASGGSAPEVLNGFDEVHPVHELNEPDGIAADAASVAVKAGGAGSVESKVNMVIHGS
jgi:hypothetical protein